ncbi:hypothetical protein C1645_742662 [Glomus cerebriforme]|uniref:Uncharacterized protein n=1 Tax=Glomus cerebriforme TaxID=658196 RepID=A0A397SIL3_9GLOM|nr:hypothetical protein C1645_742662 [Glomus cerebriforme]
MTTIQYYSKYYSLFRYFYQYGIGCEIDVGADGMNSPVRSFANIDSLDEPEWRKDVQSKSSNNHKEFPPLVLGVYIRKNSCCIFIKDNKCPNLKNCTCRTIPPSIRSRRVEVHIKKRTVRSSIFCGSLWTHGKEYTK